jgi:hypothetical protein
VDAIEGWQGRLQARGVNMSMDNWKVKASTTEVPANDFESRYRKQKHGLKGADVTFSGYVDNDNNPFTDAGGGVRAGEKIACLAYLIKGGLVFTFTFIDIFDVETGDELEGKVQISVTAKTNGSWTYPGTITA